MTTKNEFKLVDDAVSDDPYDLGRLRIDPDKLETAAAKKLLTSVPVRKPNPQDFVRVRPELDYRKPWRWSSFGTSRDLHRRSWRRA